MDLLYIPFFTVDALAIYHKNEALYHLWHYYAMLLYGTSRLGKGFRFFPKKILVFSSIRCNLHYFVCDFGKVHCRR